MWIQLLFPLIVVGAVGLLFYAAWAGRRPGAEVIASRERFALRIAFALALVPSLLLLVVPVYSGLSERTTTGGVRTTSWTSGTMLQANGSWILVVLLVPVALTAAGLAVRAAPQRRTVARIGATLLTVFVLLAIFTVGFFYLPAAVALWMAAFGTPPVERSA